MKKIFGFVMCSLVGLAGCTEVGTGSSGGDAGIIRNLPEEIVAIAAPNQDLTAVRIDPVDGCYAYRHIGPVETTYLPLRTKKGNPICSRAPEAATTS